jgi:diguanylate cyclase (GGDEF)-like protein
VDLDGVPMLVRIHPFRDDAGLDWRIVTVLAEESIAGHLERDLLTNLLVVMTITGVSVALGLSSLRRIRTTLDSLTAGSEALAAGNLNTAVPPPGIRELTPLAERFNAMGRQLRESFGQLEAQNATVHQAVVERTLQLSQANQRLEEEITKRSEAEVELRRANAELELVANTDRLTGIANRHLFDRLLEQEWNRHGRERQPLSLLLLDVDHFKQYNDTHGHLAGDSCLMEVARAIESGLQRSSDLPARFGGEEFVVLLPNTDSRGGLAVAERIQKTLRERCRQRSQEAAPEFVTASIGIASLQPRQGQRPERLLALADAALYRAKAAGRDTCCL